MVGFPLLLIPLAIYNIVVFLMPGVSFGDPLVTVPLLSSAEWQVSLSDVLLTLGILLLLLEVIKGARPGTKYVTDHLLSLVVFGAAAAEFLLWPRFASSSYFLLVLLALVDFVSGLALRVRHRTQVAAASAARQATAAEPPSAVPQFIPPSPRPAAASAGEPVDAPEPKLADTDRGSAEVPSSGLQSSNGSPPSGAPPR